MPEPDQATFELPRWAPAHRIRLSIVVVLVATCMIALTRADSTFAAWTIVSSPNPGSLENELDGVSCPSAPACVAVGSSSEKAGEAKPLAATRSGGGEWSATSPPLPAGAISGFLFGISCWSEAGCTAVGSSRKTSSEIGTPLIERWNGSEWSIESSPSVGTVSLGGISCVSSKNCIAVGTSVGETLEESSPLAERWNGKTWTIQTVAPSSEPASFDGVSCSAAKACTAVGSYFGAGGAVAQRWNGEAWSSQEAASSSRSLQAVSCPAAKVCEAVGSTSASVSAAQGWNGTAWSAQTPAGETGEEASLLRGIACPASKACTAVGSWTAAPGEERTLANGWNGIGWSLESTPNPVGALASILQGVSCVSSTECVAVGKAKTGTFTTQTLIEER